MHSEFEVIYEKLIERISHQRLNFTESSSVEQDLDEDARCHIHPASWIHSSSPP